jgi:hypothetical protein
MTVYVLGAGASHHAGYPLASGMGAELIAWMSHQAESALGYPAVANLMQEIFGPADNIEVLLTAAGKLIRDFERGTPEQRALRARVAQARFSMLQAVRDFFLRGSVAVNRRLINNLQ